MKNRKKQNGKSLLISKEMREFMKWMDTKRITVSKDVKIQEITQKSLFTNPQISVTPRPFVSVLACRDLQVDSIICKIPKDAIFSVVNSEFAQLLEGHVGALALSIALLFHLCKFTDCAEKNSSVKMEMVDQWRGYLATLPKVVDLPLLWFDILPYSMSFDSLSTCGSLKAQTNGNLPTPETTPAAKKQKILHDEKVASIADCDLKLALRSVLVGTEVERTLLKDVDLVRSDFKTIVVPLYIRLLNSNKSTKPKLKLSEIEEKELFEKFVCVSTVVSSRCFNVDSVHGDSLVPFADLFNHSLFESVHLESSDPSHNQFESDDEDEDEENEEHKKEDGDDDNMIEMRLVRNVKKGEEIWNTYGDQANVGLLCRYGFTLANNPFDYILISTDLIISVLGMDTSKMTSRVVWWMEYGQELLSDFKMDLEDDQEDEEDEQEQYDDDVEEDVEDDEENQEINFEEFFKIGKSGKIPAAMSCFISTLLVSEEFLNQEMVHELMDIWKSNYTLETIHEEYRDVLLRVLDARLAAYPTNLDENLINPFKLDHRLISALEIRKSEIEILNHVKQNLDAR